MSRAALLAPTLAASAWFRARRVRCGVVRCEGRPPLLDASGEVVLGEGVAFRNRASRTELGARPGARLEIGARAFVNQGCSLVAELSIRIGADARIGDLVGIYDSNHHALEEGAAAERAPVEIGDNVWLARGAIVLPGVTIGDHSVVAAGAVVTADVPDRVLVAGNPARVVRPLTVSPGWRRG